MRYRPEHKAEVHEKIVKDASRRIRRDGMNGAAVATVMRDTGLTHGGFYKHFESKDELVAESLREAFGEIQERLTRAAEGEKGDAAWKSIVTMYLSEGHCAHAEVGCPVAALGPELVRADGEIKERIFEEVRGYRDRMVPLMPGRRRAEKEKAFFLIFSTMIGAVQVARLMPDAEARAAVLRNARDFLLRSF